MRDSWLAAFLVKMQKQQGVGGGKTKPFWILQVMASGTKELDLRHWISLHSFFIFFFTFLVCRDDDWSRLAFERPGGPVVPATALPVPLLLLHSLTWNLSKVYNSKWITMASVCFKPLVLPFLRSAYLPFVPLDIAQYPSAFSIPLPNQTLTHRADEQPNIYSIVIALFGVWRVPINLSKRPRGRATKFSSTSPLPTYPPALPSHDRLFLPFLGSSIIQNPYI